MRVTRRSRSARPIPTTPPSSPAPACRWATTTCACSRRATSSPPCATASSASPGWRRCSPPPASSPPSSAARPAARGRRRDDPAGRQRPAQLRRLRDDRRHRLRRPEPERILQAIGAAGYEGPDLGPPGYLGEGDLLAERLAANRLQIVGGFVPLRFSEQEDVTGLDQTL